MQDKNVIRKIEFAYILSFNQFGRVLYYIIICILRYNLPSKKKKIKNKKREDIIILQQERNFF